MKYITKAFTLVELIVVVTILAILATIGFVSYSGYLTGVRDTNRVSSLTAISDGLELYRTKNDLPLPDSSVEVQVEGETIARQGYAGSNVLQTIEYSKAGKDPKDDQYYSYYLTDDKKHYQMMAFLEESDNLETKIINTSHAATDYSNRHPKVYGKRLGILTDSDNTPIQEISNIITAGNLDILSGSIDTYNAIFTDNDIFVSSGSTLGTYLRTDSSCKRLRDTGKTADGIYDLLDKNGNTIKVYCDMSNGGWALLLGVSPDSLVLKYNSTQWTAPTINENLQSPEDADQVTQAYTNLVINKIKLCKKDFSRCFEMTHNMNRTLQSFYVDDVSYTDFARHKKNTALDPTNSHNVNGPNDIGDDKMINFFTDLNIDYTLSTAYTKYGAGINIHTQNKIGFQADNNNAWPSQDNMSFAIGGFSQYPQGCNSTLLPMPAPLNATVAKSVNYHHLCSYYTPAPDQDRWFVLGQ